MKGILVLALSLTTVLLDGQTKQLNLASDVWPPFTNVDSASAVALDLVDEALMRAKVQVHTDILDFKEVLDRIGKGTLDGSAALWRSPEREKYLLFSEPYLENRLILVGKKGSNVSASGFAELKGKRIAVVGSYAYGLPPVDSKNLTLVTGSSDQQNLETLLSGKADYMLVDALLIEYLLEFQSKEAAQYLEIGKNTLLTLPLYFAIRKDIPDAQAIIGKFNQEIDKMIAEGVYNKILNLNWIASDVDGDGRTELVLSGTQAGTQAPATSYLVKTKSGQSEGEANGFYIEGIRYSDWANVPERYKVPPRTVTSTDKVGAGPVFHF